MANDANDVLMTFIKDGKGVAAESRTKWDRASEDLMDDFDDGCFFEVEDFFLGAGLEADDYHEEKNRNNTTSSTSSQGNQLHGPSGNKTGSGSDKSRKGYRGNKFANYILQKSLNYPIDVQEISISRQIDRASPVFLQSCLNLEPFTKAVIVKRKVVGEAHASEHLEHQVFLRLEFQEPLITSVEWEEGETVKEKLKFVCRGLKVSYRPQEDSGKLGPSVPAEWNPKSRLKSSGR